MTTAAILSAITLAYAVMWRSGRSRHPAAVVLALGIAALVLTNLPVRVESRATTEDKIIHLIGDLVRDKTGTRQRSS